MQRKRDELRTESPASGIEIDHDCGEMPVVDPEQSRRPIGVITDRDIVCRAVAQGKNTLSMTAGDCMTKPCVTVSPDTSLEECVMVLEETQLRRVPVVDASGVCCGIVAQADIARTAKRQAGELVQKISV